MTSKSNHEEKMEDKCGTESSGGIPYKVKAGVFLTTAAGIGMLAGFGGAIAASKKQDPRHFDAGMVGMDAATIKENVKARYLQESGASLATRALGYGTFFAFAGCGLLFFSVWKFANVNNMEEFRIKVGKVLPKIPRKNPPQGRTEFSGLNDLMQYLSDRDDEEKRLKKEQKS